MDFFHRLVRMYDEVSPSDGLVVDGVLEEITERIAAKDPDDYWLIWAPKRVRRPFRELGEIEQKDRFDLVFTRRLSVELGQGNREHGQEECASWT